MLTSDQEAQVRFAYRVWSTGNTHGAPAATVQAAYDLVDKVALNGAPTTAQGFKRAASEILNSSH